MIVTKVEQQKRHPDRVNLYLDGEFALGLHKEVLVKFSLRKGDTISKERVDELIDAEEYSRAKQKALLLINRRMRSEKEIRIKLREKEFHPRTIDSVVNYLHSIKFLNDEEFARAFIHDTQLRKPSGRKLLKLQLRLKGVTTSVVESVLNENISSSQEKKAAQDAAIKIFQRYGNSKKKIADVKKQKRIAQFLLRRGFSWSIASSVIKNIFKNQSLIDTED
jgi:regulatory protein